MKKGFVLKNKNNFNYDEIHKFDAKSMLLFDYYF